MEGRRSKHGRTDRGQVLGYFALAMIGLLIASVVFMYAFGYDEVQEGKMGVQTYFGEYTGKCYNPGPHWHSPLNGVKRAAINPQEYTMSKTEGEGEKIRSDHVPVDSADGPVFDVDVTVRFAVGSSCDQVLTFLRTFPDGIHGPEGSATAVQRIIRPAVRSTIRDEGAGIAANVIYKNEGRQRLEIAAEKRLHEEFEGTGLHLISVDVRDVDKPQDFEQQLAANEIARQAIKEEEFKVQQAEQKKQRRVIEAQADAEERTIRSKAVANATLVEARAKARAIQLENAALSSQYVQYEFYRGLGRSDTTYFFGGEDAQPIVFTGQSGGNAANVTVPTTATGDGNAPTITTDDTLGGGD